MNKESGNDPTSLQPFNAVFGRIFISDDTTLYMFFCTIWFIATFVFLFIAVELSVDRDLEEKMKTSKWLGNADADSSQWSSDNRQDN